MRHANSILALALIASMTDTMPASATETSTAPEPGRRPDRLPPTRRQQSADFRSSPGTRQHKRRKNQRRGGR